MTKIDIAAIDINLLADLDGSHEGWVAYEAAYEGATVSNQCWHIVFHAEDQRGGIVFVGSGSSGSTEWTDAASPDQVLSRMLADDMVA